MVDLGGVPPLNHFFFIFMQFSAKIMPNNKLALGAPPPPPGEILDPPLGKLIPLHHYSQSKRLSASLDFVNSAVIL